MKTRKKTPTPISYDIYRGNERPPGGVSQPAPTLQAERAEAESIPWAWVEKAILRRIEKIREEIISVQMRLDFHPSWLVVWHSVNEALSDIRSMRQFAHEANRNDGKKSPLQRPKFGALLEAGVQPVQARGRTPEDQRAAIMEFAQGVVDVLRDADPDPASQPGDRSQIPLVESGG